MCIVGLELPFHKHMYTVLERTVIAGNAGSLSLFLGNYCFLWGRKHKGMCTGEVQAHPDNFLRIYLDVLG